MLYFTKRFWRAELALGLAFLFSAAASAAGFSLDCARVRGEVLRLHVLADSDSPADQALKLQVRDAVLRAGNTLFDGSTTADSAHERLAAQTDALTAAARAVLRENGSDAAVDIRVTEEYFATRSYEDVTLPAGRYTAVKVVIGSGAGQNWWCVMFPPMCLPAAEGEALDADAYWDEDEYAVVSQNPQYEPRFKIVEWAQLLRERWR